MGVAMCTLYCASEDDMAHSCQADACKLLELMHAQCHIVYNVQTHGYASLPAARGIVAVATDVVCRMTFSPMLSPEVTP